MKNLLRSLLLTALLVTSFLTAAWSQPAPGTGGPLAGPGAAPGAGPAPAPAPLGAPLPAVAAAPEPASLDDAWAAVAVGDLPGFVDGLGLLAGQFPDMPNGMMMKGLLGMQLQDPALEGLPVGSGVVAVFFAPARAMLFAQVAPAKADAYVAAIRGAAQPQGRRRGGLPFSAADKAEGLVVAAQNDADLALAVKFAPEAKKRFLSAPGKPVLNLTLYTQRAVPLAEPWLKMIVQSSAMARQMQQKPQGGADVGIAPAPAPAGSMTPERIFEAEVNVLLNLARESNTVAVTVAPAGGGVRFETAVDAKPDSELGKFLAAAPPKESNVAKIVPARGAVRAVLAYNGAAFTSLVKAEADAVMAQMKMEGEEKDAVQKYLEMMQQSQVSAAAMDFLVPGGPVLSGSVAQDTVDPAKAVAALKDSPQKMQGMLKMQEAAGMKTSVEFQENVRQVKGVAVHRLKITMQAEPGKMPQQQDEMMRKFLGDAIVYDIAVVDKTVLLAIGGQSIEDLVTAAQAKANPAAGKLAAQTVFGTGAQAYGDFDLAKALQTCVTAFDLDAMAQVGAHGLKPSDYAAAMTGAAPVTMAGFWGQGAQGRVSLDVPADLMAKIAAVVAKDADMNPGAGAPAPADGGLGAPAAPGAGGGQPPRSAPRPQF